jgi:hypothetical protein
VNRFCPGRSVWGAVDAGTSGKEEVGEGGRQVEGGISSRRYLIHCKNH